MLDSKEKLATARFPTCYIPVKEAHKEKNIEVPSSGSKR